MERPPVQPASRKGLWRWFIALLVIGSYPLLPIFLHNAGSERDGPALPESIPGLLVFCALQMAIFGAYWGVAWLFARPNREQVGWQWRGDFQPVGWGFVYFAVLRFAPVVLLMMVAVAAVAAGVDLKQLLHQIQQNKPNTDALVSAGKLGSDPLYLFVVTTLVAFVVAGLREELWRAFTLSALSRVLPASWTLRTRQILAVAVTSVLFGAGHIVQGPLAMVVTACLGVVLGSAILIHRSIWPAVIAHGLFDATSFLLLPLAAQVQKSGMATKILMLLGW
jgi:membrane protease YdiL (CAAX protease family)